MPAYADVERIGWVTSLHSLGHGAGAIAIRSLLHKLDDADADIIGLIVLPDDDAFVQRLVNYYRRFGFELVGVEEYGDGYPVMIRDGR